MAWAWYKERTQVILYSNRLAEDSGDPPPCRLEHIRIANHGCSRPLGCNEPLMPPLVGQLTASDCAEPRLEGTFMSQRMCVRRLDIDTLH